MNYVSLATPSKYMTLSKATCKQTQQLGVAGSAVTVVCKEMQQLPTICRPAVYCGKDTTQKTLEVMCNVHAWSQHCWRSCANGCNIVALCFGDHGTKDTVGSCCTTTCNRVCKQVQHVTSNDARSCWPTMLRPFAWGLTFKY